MNFDLQRPLRVLHLERDADIAVEILNQLHASGLYFGVRRVATRAAYFEALRQYQPDIVVAGDAVDASAVIEIAGEFSSTLPVVFFVEGGSLGGVVQGAVAQARAERERQMAGQERWALRNVGQAMHGLAVAARLRELRLERKAG